MVTYKRQCFLQALQAMPGSFSALLTDQDPLPGSPAQVWLSSITSEIPSPEAWHTELMGLTKNGAFVKTQSPCVDSPTPFATGHVYAQPCLTPLHAGPSQGQDVDMKKPWRQNAWCMHTPLRQQGCCAKTVWTAILPGLWRLGSSLKVKAR